MIRMWRFVAWPVLAALLGGIGFLAYQEVSARRPTPDKEEPLSPLPRVTVQPVERGTVTRSTFITGDLRPFAAITVISKITGRLEQLRLPDGTPIEDGTPVSQGTVIAVIEHKALQAAVDQAKAAQEVCEAALGAAKVGLGSAEREKERWKQLYDRGSAASDEWDRASTAYDRALAEVRLCQAQIAQAKAALAQAQTTLDEATIEAAITGVVSTKRVDEGDTVAPQTPLMDIVDINAVKVVGGLPEQYLAAVKPRVTPVEITVDAYGAEPFTGVVHLVAVAVDPQTRTAQVEVRVPNPDHRLKPGMFARLELVLERREGVLIVADSTLVRQSSSVSVFVENGSVVYRRSVKLGLSQGERHEVIEGLNPGDRVVVRGQHLLVEGQRVEVAEESAS